MSNTPPVLTGPEAALAWRKARLVTQGRGGKPGERFDLLIRRGKGKPPARLTFEIRGDVWGRRFPWPLILTTALVEAECRGKGFPRGS